MNTAGIALGMIIGWFIGCLGTYLGIYFFTDIFKKKNAEDMEDVQ